MSGAARDRYLIPLAPFSRRRRGRLNLGVSSRFFFLPRSLAKGAGDTGGEGFEIISKRGS